MLPAFYTDFHELISGGSTSGEGRRASCCIRTNCGTGGLIPRVASNPFDPPRCRLLGQRGKPCVVSRPVGIRPFQLLAVIQLQPRDFLV